MTDKDIEKIQKENAKRDKEVELACEKDAQKIVGKTIKAVRYMTKKEADEMGWYKRPIVILFTDGSHMFPSTDDEGNDGGALFGLDENGKNMDICVINS
jgi:hypothetical protein